MTKFSLPQRRSPGMGLLWVPAGLWERSLEVLGQGDVAARSPDRPPGQQRARGTRAKSGQRKKQRR